MQVPIPYIQDPDLGIRISADSLAHNEAKSPGASELNLHMFHPIALALWFPISIEDSVASFEMADGILGNLLVPVLSHLCDLYHLPSKTRYGPNPMAVTLQRIRMTGTNHNKTKKKLE